MLVCVHARCEGTCEQQCVWFLPKLHMEGEGPQLLTQTEINELRILSGHTVPSGFSQVPATAEQPWKEHWVSP